MSRNAPSRYLQRALERTNTPSIMIRYDDGHHYLEIPQGLQLGDDSGLDLPKFRHCLAVFKP